MGQTTGKKALRIKGCIEEKGDILADSQHQIFSFTWVKERSHKGMFPWDSSLFSSSHILFSKEDLSRFPQHDWILNSVLFFEKSS